MNKLTTIILSMLLICGVAVAANGPAIVPIPQSIDLKQGEGAILSPTSSISINSKDETARTSATIFSAFLARECGLELPITTYKGAQIALSVNASIASEGYRLTIGKGRVFVVGGSPSGLFYGLQTLRQLVAQYGVRLPAMSIVDAPTLAYRGAMLDCCRHFFSVDQVKVYIDMLAMHKINRFHWHLTEDQGWRIEIKRYPLLTTVGSRRAETALGSSQTEFDGVPYGGFYTQDQIREVVAYAADRFIEIIPEIEMPGHSSAALTAYPWLGCVGEGYQVRTHWGVFPEIYCAGRESTFEFMENVLAEVIELFPSAYIHIGGDECPKQSWQGCPECQKRIVDNALKNEEELQSYFIHRIEGWLNARGRQIIGWDEILEGGISSTATIMSWRGAEGGIAAAKAGNKVIMTPNTHCYLDYYQTAKPKVLEPGGIGGYVPLSKCYGIDLYEGLTEDQRPYIIGIQGNVWTEFISTFGHAQHMARPRLAALAEVGWSYDKRDLDAFRTRMSSLRTLYQKNGYNYAPYFFDGTDQ